MNKLCVTLMAALLAIACGKTPQGSGAEQLPGVPQNVELHSATETSLTLQWNAVEGAKSYEWKLTLDGADVKSGSVSQRNVTVTGLTPGTAYGFSVQAVNDAGKSGWSTSLEVSTTGSKPVPGTFCVDAPLVVEVGSGASLGTSGLIQVFKADGTPVDKIDMADMAKAFLVDPAIARHILNGEPYGKCLHCKDYCRWNPWEMADPNKKCPGAIKFANSQK